MADDIRRAPAVEELLAAAEQIARDRGEDWVGVEHLQLAILGDPHAAPAFELRYRMGVDTAEFARRLHEFLDAPIPGPDEYRVRPLEGPTSVRPPKT
ncbi:hypothetical protein [Nocardia sp. N2S4-5]|uniref:hypothetical protein n=1 Tax=Nocardia sp. N2S4-5 TaxID=3351565 RepID=UPI0037D5567B